MEAKSLSLTGRRSGIPALTSDYPMGLALSVKYRGTEYERRMKQYTASKQGAQSALYVGDADAVSGGFWRAPTSVTSARPSAAVPPRCRPILWLSTCSACRSRGRNVSLEMYRSALPRSKACCSMWPGLSGIRHRSRRWRSVGNRYRVRRGHLAGDGRHGLGGHCLPDTVGGAGMGVGSAVPVLRRWVVACWVRRCSAPRWRVS